MGASVTPVGAAPALGSPVDRLRNVAVVLAGGTGTRVGLSIPKQLIKIAGKPIIEHTIAAMQESPLVDEIIVLMAPGYLDEVRAIVRNGGYTKVTQILEGAGTRNDTTAAALAALGEQECNVLLHDAVRPLVSQTIIAANVEALQTYDAVDTAIPSADTVIQVEPATARRSPTCCPGTCCAAARPRSRFRLSTIRAGLRRRPPRTRSSPPPTTARWCCATCPRCRSPSCPATSAT